MSKPLLTTARIILDQIARHQRAFRPLGADDLCTVAHAIARTHPRTRCSPLDSLLLLAQVVGCSRFLLGGFCRFQKDIFDLFLDLFEGVGASGSNVHTLTASYLDVKDP